MLLRMIAHPNHVMNSPGAPFINLVQVGLEQGEVDTSYNFIKSKKAQPYAAFRVGLVEPVLNPDIIGEYLWNFIYNW